MTPHPAAFAVFHLNLAFSAIPTEARPEVIRGCYHPLLDLVEAGYPFGIELSGWTLEQIHEIDPAWVRRLGDLLAEGRCEVVGSGWAQIIGPLAPAVVNRWNQELGRRAYRDRLGAEPAIALVNEMAFSSSLVDLYAGAGYAGLIMDRDNVRLALGLDGGPLADTPSVAAGSAGAALPVLWADSILFQKLQQVVHGDIRERDYLDHLRQRIERGEALLPLYANDAEVFDHRPGRFETEARLHADGEWARMSRIIDDATEGLGLRWLLPSQALAEAGADGDPVTMASAAFPVPVKKQAKYNLARWAASGRGDVWLNTMAHRLSAASAGSSDTERWRRVCEVWATDLRTHITETRWHEAAAEVHALAVGWDISLGYGSGDRTPAGSPDPDPPEGIQVRLDDDGIGLSVETPSVRMMLNRRRGLTIQELAFAAHDGVATIGTLPHGYFDTIALGADFYTGGVVVELPETHRRITDLEWVTPSFVSSEVGLEIRASIETELGPIDKTVTVSIDGSWVEFGYRFPGWERPRGTIRAGTVTLLPSGLAVSPTIGSCNGGAEIERFVIDGRVDHAGATSALISSTAGFGATDGRIEIGGHERGLVLSWDPAECAVFPMLLHEPAAPSALTRVFFSLQELDDTLRPGGPIGAFRLRVEPRSD